MKEFSYDWVCEKYKGLNDLLSRYSVNNLFFLGKDGTKWYVLIGANFQGGLVGFGGTIQQALYDLADQLYTCPCCGSSDVKVCKAARENYIDTFTSCNECKEEVVIHSYKNEPINPL